MFLRLLLTTGVDRSVPGSAWRIEIVPSSLDTGKGLALHHTQADCHQVTATTPQQSRRSRKIRHRWTSWRMLVCWLRYIGCTSHGGTPSHTPKRAHFMWYWRQRIPCTYMEYRRFHHKRIARVFRSWNGNLADRSELKSVQGRSCVCAVFQN